VSVDYRRFIGHFFATKADIGCQIADITSYIAARYLKDSNPYGKRVGKYYEAIEDRFLVNKIIEMNSG